MDFFDGDSSPAALFTPDVSPNLLKRTQHAWHGVYRAPDFTVSLTFGLHGGSPEVDTCRV